MIFDVQQDRSLVALNAKTGAAIWTWISSQVGTFGAASHQNGPGLSLFYNDGKDGLVIAASNRGRPASRARGRLRRKTGKLVWQLSSTLPIRRSNRSFSRGRTRPVLRSGVSRSGRRRRSIPSSVRCTSGPGTYPEQGRTPGLSLWADSIVSLDIKTGQLKWYFQAVHHDIYDYDRPTPPVLFNTTMAGKPVKAVAVAV
jgi:glucose dehydrogenase